MTGIGEGLARLLGGLDDHEMKLLSRQTQLTEELRAVEEELGRITAVREAALGKPPKQDGKSSAAYSAEEAEKRRAQVLAFLEGKEPQAPRALADALGLEPRGIGPILTRMVRAEQITRLEDGRYERRG